MCLAQARGVARLDGLGTTTSQHRWMLSATLTRGVNMGGLSKVCTMGS